MARLKLVVIASLAVVDALTGCSALSLSGPKASSQKPPAPPVQTVQLQFQSEPPGASVRTAQGQECQTPCYLSVTAESQSVTFSKLGFLPQTIQIKVADAPQNGQNAHPALMPNPVGVVLQPTVTPVPGVATAPIDQPPKQQSEQAFPRYFPATTPTTAPPEVTSTVGSQQPPH